MIHRSAYLRSRMAGVMLLSLFACRGKKPAACAEPSLSEGAAPPQGAPSQSAQADIVPVSHFVESLPPTATCGVPCGPSEEALRVSGSCICALDVTAVGNPTPPQDRWFVARGPHVLVAERDPLIACEEAPLEALAGQTRRGCPFSGRELLISYGAPPRPAIVASFAADHLLRVRTQEESGETQSVPFSLPSGSALVGVFRSNPFSGPPSTANDPIFVAWRVLLPPDAK